MRFLALRRGHTPSLRHFRYLHATHESRLILARSRPHSVDFACFA